MFTTLTGNVMLMGQQGSLVLFVRQLENEGKREDAKSLLFSVVTFTLAAAGLLLGVLLVIGPKITPYVVNQPRFTFNPYMQIALLTAYAGVVSRPRCRP